MRKLLLSAFSALIMSHAANAAVVDAFSIDGTTPTGTVSSIILEVGRLYEITVSGTIFIATGRLADAEYYQLSGSLDWNDVRPPDIGVQIDGLDVAWGDFDPSHNYTISFLGTGSAITMSFLDITGGYSDNSGSLAVSISAVPLPASALLMLGGLAALGAVRKRRQKA